MSDLFGIGEAVIVKELTSTSLKVASALGYDRELRELIGKVAESAPSHAAISKK